jgi:hypothetical protein
MKTIIMISLCMCLVSCRSRIYEEDFLLAQKVCENNEGLSYMLNESGPSRNMDVYVCKNGMTIQRGSIKTTEVSDKGEKQ